VTRYLLDELADRLTAEGVRDIPRLCSCRWRPHYITVPAVWTLTEADPQCKVHGSDEHGEGT